MFNIDMQRVVAPPILMKQKWLNTIYLEAENKNFKLKQT